MEVRGSAPDCACARIGALAGPVPVGSAGLPGPTADRRSSLLGALAEGPLERVVRLAAVVLDTPWASVTVAGKRFSSGRSCLASMRGEAHGKTRRSVILAAMNQALLDWLTDDRRFLTAIYAVTLALKGSQHETVGQPGCGGAWLAAARSRQTGPITPTAATAGMPLQTTMRCPRPAVVRVSGGGGRMLRLNGPVGPAVGW